MKTSHIFEIALVFITLVFVLASVNFSKAKSSAPNLSAASFSQQIATPSATAKGVSEVGSTDGIVIMGFVLAVIVTVPVLFHRKRKG